ncbi:MAG TPA: hypothetical protein VLX29_00415 [Nitrospirota bacterium]|nr:hypothetical protein [Nitrospirota bacterium]
MKDLTKFQLKCEAALLTTLAATGHHLVNRKISGKSETYITGQISRTINEIYIYPKEASILGPKIDLRFKSSDYETSDKLVNAFIKKIMTLFY